MAWVAIQLTYQSPSVDVVGCSDSVSVILKDSRIFFVQRNVIISSHKLAHAPNNSLNISSANASPSSVKTTDLALLLGLLINSF